MAMPKKGTRSITVESRQFRWKVTHEHGNLRLIVELYENPGRKMLMLFDSHDYKEGSMAQEPKTIAPSLVSQAIVYAMKNGWDPEEKGSEMSFGKVEDLEE